MLNVDRIGSVVMLVVVSVAWSQIGLIGQFGDLFPRLVLWPLTILSVVLLTKSFVRPEKVSRFFDQSPVRLLVVVAATLAWVLLLDVLGFLAASVLAYSFLTWFIGGMSTDLRKLGISTVIVIAEVGFIYWVFTDLLLVPLPEGIFI